MNKDDFVMSVAQLRTWLVERGVNSPRITIGDDHPFSLLVSKYYLELIDWDNADDPLAKMVITSDSEHETQPYELEDPICDKQFSPVPGIVHRHPDRCLLMVTNMCAVHCRFCFRRSMLESNKADLTKAIEYIAKTPQICEVILSGGDPFTFTNHFMKHIVDRLNTIDHVRFIRFHTRTPTVYPARIMQEFVDAMVGAKQTTVVIHINHPREITKEFVDSVHLMKRAGIMLLSQSVLLRGVNDSFETLRDLFYGLYEIGVKPYYLHHLDKAMGTHHFRISIEKGKQLYAQLRTSISGVCLPAYVIDIPGGHGKHPVESLTQIGADCYQIEVEHKKIRYIDPAADPDRG